MKKILFLVSLGAMPLLSADQGILSQQNDAAIEQYRVSQDQLQAGVVNPNAPPPEQHGGCSPHGGCPHCSHKNAPPYQHETPYPWSADPYPDL